MTVTIFWLFYIFSLSYTDILYAFSGFFHFCYTKRIKIHRLLIKMLKIGFTVYRQQRDKRRSPRGEID